MSKEYIERGAVIAELEAHKAAADWDVLKIHTDSIIALFNRLPAADVEPVVKRTTFSESEAASLNDFIDNCEVDSESMSGFIQDRFKSWLRALVYEAVPANMDEGSGRA